MGSTTVTNLKIFATVIVTLGAYTWVANAIPQLESEVPEEISFTGEVSGEELAAVGEDLFVGAGGCTACHGSGTRAPNLRADHAGEGPIGARCGNRQDLSCKDYLWNSMVNPGAYLVEGFGNIMPPQNRILSSNQIWALIAYLESLGGEVTVTGADLQTSTEAGGQGEAAVATGTEVTDPMAMLQTNACLGCHTLNGEGVELGPTLDGIGSRRDAEYIRRSILDPNADAPEGFEDLLGTMPATFGQALSDEQLDILVEFLTLQEE